jgi:hypothetical protein
VNPCLQFFKTCVEGEVAGLLQNQPDAVVWEQMTASDFSPGPVQVPELLIRLVYHPIHVDAETGELKPSVVAEASSWGCSVQRETYCPEEHAWRLGEQQARAKSEASPDKPRQVHAITVLDVAKLRGLVQGEKRALAVYDTALPDNSAHSDVFVIVAGKQQGRSARAQLFEWARLGRKAKPVAVE